MLLEVAIVHFEQIDCVVELLEHFLAPGFSAPDRRDGFLTHHETRSHIRASHSLLGMNHATEFTLSYACRGSSHQSLVVDDCIRIVYIVTNLLAWRRVCRHFAKIYWMNNKHARRNLAQKTRHWLRQFLQVLVSQTETKWKRKEIGETPRKRKRERKNAFSRGKNKHS